MSTQRFPRTRIARDLARLETEVSHWSAYYSTLSYSPHDQLKSMYEDRSGLLEELARVIHDAADLVADIRPLRSPTFRR